MVTGLTMVNEFSFNQSNKLYIRKNPQHTLGKSWVNCLARHFAQLFPHVCGGIKDILFSALKLNSNCC